MSATGTLADGRKAESFGAGNREKWKILKPVFLGGNHRRLYYENIEVTFEHLYTYILLQKW